MADTGDWSDMVAYHAACSQELGLASGACVQPGSAPSFPVLFSAQPELAAGRTGAGRPGRRSAARKQDGGSHKKKMAAGSGKRAVSKQPSQGAGASAVPVASPPRSPPGPCQHGLRPGGECARKDGVEGVLDSICPSPALSSFSPAGPRRERSRRGRKRRAGGHRRHGHHRRRRSGDVKRRGRRYSSSSSDGFSSSSATTSASSGSWRRSSRRSSRPQRRSRRREVQRLSVDQEQLSQVVPPAGPVEEVQAVVPVPRQVAEGPSGVGGTSGSGESACGDAWLNKSIASGADLISVLKAVVAGLKVNEGTLCPSVPPEGAMPPSEKENALASLTFRDSLFCGVAPLGTHLSAEIKDKIWRNEFVDIWSLVSVEQVTVDKERGFERGSDRKAKVAKTFGNWVQCYATLAHVICQRYPGKGAELFVYFDTIFSAHRLHGGAAWWRYDEEFRRRLALSPDISWATKATDVWLQLILAQGSRQQRPFPSAAAAPGPAPGVAAARPTGACWLYNEGHCRFFATCKFQHECSICGGAHAALRCFRRGKQPVKAPPSGAAENAGERSRDGPMVRAVPQEAGSRGAH
ncbi:uncharacterized protein LOC142660963 isoform X1 [Rhinoderma darwinii]|uniref:uncharacterized protein LOC142660963 isoform X1 n=1 Tax=Rhinoderma darwinii TaxID=43563 RepID=UPI003F667DBC